MAKIFNYDNPAEDSTFYALTDTVTFYNSFDFV